MRIFLKYKSPVPTYIFFLIWFLPWTLVNIFYKTFGVYKNPNEKIKAGVSLKNLRDGDVLLMRRKIPAPWGYWGHCGMVMDAAKGKAIHSVYGIGVEVVDIEKFFCGSKFTVLRPAFADTDELEQMVRAAKDYIGKPFTFLDNKYRDMQKEPHAFSCSGFLHYMFQRACSVDIPSGSYTLPDTFCVNKNYFRQVIERHEA